MRKKSLETAISHLTSLLNQLRMRMDDSEEYNAAYNKLLIQRAQLRKKLEDKKTSNIVQLFGERWNIIKRIKNKNKKVLISDYF